MATYLKHAAGLASRRIGDEEVIVSPKAGKIWSLNPAGTYIWELLDGSQDEASLAADLAACRGLDPSAAVDELRCFTELLQQRGLLVASEGHTPQGSRSARAAKSPPESCGHPPSLVREEELQVLAGACGSGHTGQGAACMLFGSCAVGFS